MKLFWKSTGLLRAVKGTKNKELLLRDSIKIELPANEKLPDIDVLVTMENYWKAKVKTEYLATE